jgi:excisionase family DNA binding protein
LATPADTKAMTELLTLKEFAAMLRLAKPTVARMRARGEFPVVKIGSRVFITADDAEAFVAARRVPASQVAAAMLAGALKAAGPYLPQNEDGPEATGPTLRACSAGSGGGDDED